LIKKLDKIERIEVENEDVSKFNIRFVQSVVPGKVIFEAQNLGKNTGIIRFLTCRFLCSAW
jgi:ATP-binding cassette subfamily F protein 3